MKFTAILFVVIASVALARPPPPDPCVWDQAGAKKRLEAAGITAVATGNCTDRLKPNCTSYEGIQCNTVDNLIILKKASGCTIVVTSGTEVGHPTTGGWTHERGYVVGLRKNTCLNKYIHTRFRKSICWESAAGNKYCDAGSHWEVTFINLSK